MKFSFSPKKIFRPREPDYNGAKAIPARGSAKIGSALIPSGVGGSVGSEVMTVSSTSGLIQNCLDRHNAGDPAARDELVQYCQHRLRVIVRKMLRRFPNVQRWEDTSDVFQNVLIRLDRTLRQVTLGTVRDFFHLAAWHIRRELIDLSRQYKQVQAQFPDQVEPVDDSANPVSLAKWGEIHSFIAALPDEVREAFDLIFYQGLSQPEAARILGISLSTVKRRWLDARLRLMNWMGSELPF